ncbi:hypothetical protein KY338_02260 [Candidatus Woesearchaeota archaeon]|nr:hypothetical protein [Candidatus Woesearchaeota archaeon]MBW3006115.1 hypothetical protein [Candidatus Woesearchaeota archaeon]
MHIRRLVKAGPASHTVSLPKKWIEKNNLEKGHNVYLIEKSDKELVIMPELNAEKQEQEQKEITINIDKKELDTIQREITSAYVNNYNTITIFGDSLSEKVKQIRKMLHDFVALEISEQTAKSIIAKDLLNLKEISVDKTIKRMDMIVRTMLKDIAEGIEDKKFNYETIVFRDYDVNRLYFLLSRLLKSAVTDNQLAEDIGIEKIQILPSWYLSMNLENLADCVKHMCTTAGKIDKKELSKIKPILVDLDSQYTKVMKALHSDDKKLADEVARKRIELVKQCTSLITKNTAAETVELVENIKTGTTLISNIARIVLDKE